MGGDHEVRRPPRRRGRRWPAAPRRWCTCRCRCRRPAACSACRGRAPRSRRRRDVEREVHTPAVRVLAQPGEVRARPEPAMAMPHSSQPKQTDFQVGARARRSGARRRAPRPSRARDGWRRASAPTPWRRRAAPCRGRPSGGRDRRPGPRPMRGGRSAPSRCRARLCRCRQRRRRGRRRTRSRVRRRSARAGARQRAPGPHRRPRAGRREQPLVGRDERDRLVGARGADHFSRMGNSCPMRRLLAILTCSRSRSPPAVVTRSSERSPTERVRRVPLARGRDVIGTTPKGYKVVKGDRQRSGGWRTR